MKKRQTKLLMVNLVMEKIGLKLWAQIIGAFLAALLLLFLSSNNVVRMGVMEYCYACNMVNGVCEKTWDWRPGCNGQIFLRTFYAQAIT